MLPNFLDENLPDNEVWPGSQVRYLSESERDSLEINIIDGKLFDSTGGLFDTDDVTRPQFGGDPAAIFVMDENGTFYASKYQKIGEFHHSSILAGRPVAAAGEMGVEDGRLVYLSDKSGHYRARREFIEQAIAALKNAGVDLTNVKLKRVGR